MLAKFKNVWAPSGLGFLCEENLSAGFVSSWGLSGILCKPQILVAGFVIGLNDRFNWTHTTRPCQLSLLLCVRGLPEKKQKPIEELPLLNSRPEVPQVPVHILLDQHSWGQATISWLWFQLQSYRMGQRGLQDHFTLRSLEAVILTWVFWRLARQSDLEINVKRKLTEGQGKQRWGIHPQRHFVPPGTMPTIERKLCW